MSKVKFSIVIPAYNEETGISKSVKSLLNLNYPREQYEIIVVDNNSADKTSLAAKEAGADKVILETEKGTNFARERGRKEARGEIVAFLDADSEAYSDWLHKIEASLSLPGVAAVSGPYDHGFKGIRRTLDDLYQIFILPRVPKILSFLFGRKAGILIGGNFAGRAETFEKIGGLPPLRFWGDDVAIAMLISRRVGKVLFDPYFRVKSSARRFEKEGFFSLFFRYVSTYLKIYFSKDYR
jgi:glycosyltransferase involved in cell wall biosynthesis